jgi:hypothetical protein
VKQSGVFLLLAAGLIFLFSMLNFVVRHPEGTLDFINLYTAGTILRQGSERNLYDVALQTKIQREILPHGRFLPFDHPPFEAWLFAPLARLSFRHAFLVWAAVNLALLALIFYLLRFTGVRLSVNGSLVWIAVCFPLVAGVLVLGQDSLFLAPVFLLAFLALKRRWDFAAGLALGLGLFRFEILLPFAFIFLLRRRWKVLAGFSAASLAALAASLALVGWSGLVAYWRLLLEVGRTAGSEATGVEAATMPSLRGAVATLLGGVVPRSFHFPLILAGTLGLLVWAAWRFKAVARPRDPAFDLEFSFATIAALLASYHIFIHELTPLIVVAFLMLGYEGARRRQGLLGNRRGTALLLLFSLVFVVGGLSGFRDFSVLFVVLLGMMAWLAWELADLSKSAAAG